MIFPYDTYLVTMLIIPITILLSLMIVLVVSLFYGFWFKTTAPKKTFNNTVCSIFCFLVIFGCAIPQCKYLMNGGIYLVIEKEIDACTFVGVIEDITEPSQYFPGFKSSHKYGADLIIDGMRFFALTSGQFGIGEIVSVRYLPNSHFILEMCNDVSTIEIGQSNHLHTISSQPLKTAPILGR